jgi:hypothetical protein
VAALGLAFTPDPISGDLIESADGWWAEDETATAAVHCQLTHELDACPQDPNSGTRLGKAFELGDGPDGVEFVVVELQRTMGVLAEDSLIGQLEVAADRTAAGRVEGQTSYRDLLSGQRIDLNVDPFDGR